MYQSTEFVSISVCFRNTDLHTNRKPSSTYMHIHIGLRFMFMFELDMSTAAMSTS